MPTNERNLTPRALGSRPGDDPTPLRAQTATNIRQALRTAAHRNGVSIGTANRFYALAIEATDDDLIALYRAFLTA